MAKIKLTKNELKRQKEDLKRFERYLPMLQLKKKQLQLEIIKIHQSIREVSQKIDSLRQKVVVWADVFAQKVPLREYCSLSKIKTSEGNVAGIELPIFEGVEFKESEYSFLHTPLWVDKALSLIKEMISLKAKMLVHHQQVDILKEELRIANQRVNLFEKVKIPQTQDDIRVIQIHLGELQTAEVVRGKIAKAKIERKKILNKL